MLNPADLVRTVLERLGDAVEGTALYLADEIADWPPGALDALLRANLLKEASPAEAVLCDGCEQQCIRSVLVNQTLDGQCLCTYDLRADTYIVAIAADRLRRWHSSLILLGGFVARELEISPPRGPIGSDSMVVGSVVGRRGRRTIKVELRGREPVIHVGSHGWRSPLC
jgi:hypothetical protein